MKFGIAYFPTDNDISTAELAPALEERGFESLWVAEHTHIPASRLSPWPAGGELPKDYWHTLDPFIALTVAARATRTLKVGTGICLVIEHDTIDMAKGVASLDHVSDGRFLFGGGAGWNREEMEDHGTPFERRFKVMRERIEAMKEIWTKEESEYHGEFVNFDPMWLWPKPVQKPHPPIHVGGGGENVLKRVIRYGDGWMPNRGEIMGRIPELRRMAEEAGRDGIEITTYGTVRGGAEEIERHLEVGVDRMLWYVPTDGRDSALRRVEAITELTQAHRG